MLADALMRSVAGTAALLRVTGANADTSMSEVGLLPTNLSEVIISPVLMRKLRPTWQEGGDSKWELMMSASAVEAQVLALDLASAQALFSMTLAISVGGQDYLIQSIATNEAFGTIYLYRLLLREAGQQAL